MRPVLVALPAVLALLAAAPGSAQSIQAFQDLALRINLRDLLQIDDESGSRTAGRLTRLTRDEMSVETGAGEKRFTSATVREVAVRRQSHRIGVLFGAGIGAAVGALAACVGPDRTECADGPILIGALGAGVGLAVSALDHRATTVYRRPMDVAPAAGSTRPRGPFE